ncbi:acetate/propionate family kinase [Lacibacterium aquatile]|uniref:Acetate kinase n=1 Tax=Lacibacterium aquatile TaxID=1168082 RepID=A0ABW5DUL6_9PROT
MKRDLLLTFNAGSSTVKLGLFEIENGQAEPLGSGILDLREQPLELVLRTDVERRYPLTSKITEDMRAVLGEVLQHLDDLLDTGRLIAIAHRVVHGGDRFDGPVLLADDSRKALEALIPLAPLHQPQSLRLLDALHRMRPEVFQTLSFDTAFHRSQSDIVRRFALPRQLHDQGLKRYGFHGLSYKYIASVLDKISPRAARGRTIVAHLGSGASLCAMLDGVSQDTSMGFSTLDGIPMATRCGAIDPGVVLHLLKKQGPDAVEHLLYRESGLLGLSGISADSRDLLASDRPEAEEAMAVFTFRIAGEIARLAVSLGGLDAIVFTAGIGEHQSAVRTSVCAQIRWLGVELNDELNLRQTLRISNSESRVEVLVVPTNEEQVIANEALEVLHLTLPTAGLASLD